MPNKPIDERTDEQTKDAKVKRDQLEDLDVRAEEADKVKAGRQITSDPCEGGE